MDLVDAALMAERFVRERDGRWLDLATGDRVCLRVLPAVARRRHARWLERTSALFGIWHPHLATPVDFGTLPDGRRFEALPCTREPSAGSAEAQRRAFETAAAFLRALGRSAGRERQGRVREVSGGLALTCDGLTGWPLGRRTSGEEPGRAAPGAVAGVRLQPRAAIEWVIGLLEAADSGGPRSLALGAAPGAGWRTFQRAIAREARVRGFVPLCPRAAAACPHVGDLVAGRHLLLIDDRRERTPGSGDQRARRVSELLLRIGLRDLRGCVVVSAVDGEESPVTDLDPLPASTLVQMVVGGGVSPASMRERARQAGGNPGRFLSLVACATTARLRRPSVQPAFVRETRPAYRSVEIADQGRPAASGDGRPVRGDSRMLARCRRVMALARRGRHAAAGRLARALVAACDRRGDEGAAAEMALSLGGLLIDRGRPEEALPWLERAAGSDRLVTRLRGAIVLGSALIEVGGLGRAEGLCRTAALVARREGHTALEGEARLALSAVLFWQGRYREAAGELEQAGPAASPVACEWRVARAAVCLAQGRTAEAGRLASAAVAAARRGSADRDLVRAATMMAALSTTLADADAANAHLREAVAAARRGRLALAGLRARLEAAEGWVRAGCAGEARALVCRLGRRRRALPPLLRARLEAVLGRAGDEDAARSAARFTASSGAVLAATSREDSDMTVIDEATDIMAACQEAEAPEAALAATCRRLVDRLGARGAAIVARDGEADTVLARVGPSWPCLEGGAASALATGGAVAPRLGAGGIESAVAVRYAGSTIGAVTCRWPADARVEAPRVAALLSAAAAACAPAVRTSIDTRIAIAPARERAAAALLGDSGPIEGVRTLVAHAARAPFAVLIEGESGTGKELVARLIHETGPRRGHRFCAVNCAALGDDLLEAELFGHARGAFTGAVAERAGLFEEADRGTLLLDEVSDLSARAQAKLLRAIQDGEVRRLGENLPRRVDVRIVAATNRPLDDEVRRGRFRADLRYRLDVVRINVPPLRDRLEDLPMLAAHFWRQACARTGNRLTLAPDVMAALARYDWPGNVRELQNVMASLAVHGGVRGGARTESLPVHIARAAPLSGGTLDEARASFERRFVRAALARAGGHRGRAARALGISRQGLAKLIKRLELEAAG